MPRWSLFALALAGVAGVFLVTRKPGTGSTSPLASAGASSPPAFDWWRSSWETMLGKENGGRVAANTQGAGDLIKDGVGDWVADRAEDIYHFFGGK